MNHAWLACGAIAIAACGGIAVTSAEDGGTDGAPGHDASADVATPGIDAGPDVDAASEAGQDVLTAPEVYEPPLPASSPTCTPPGGVFSSPQSVTLSDATANATIYYTLDHTNPNPASQVYSTPISVTQQPQVEIRAYAVAPGFSPSNVTSCVYTINIAGLGELP